MQRVRELIFAGQESEAEKIINNEFIKGPHGMKYLTLGSLFFTDSGVDEGQIRNYRRELDLTTALSTESFESKGANFKRTYFSSIPDNLIIIRLESDTKSSFNITHKCYFRTSYSASQGGIVGKVQGLGHEGIDGNSL